MKYSLVLAIIYSLLSNWSFSGNDNLPIGSRSAAVSNASLTYKDVWSLWQNQAGIASLKEVSTGAFYENRFLLPELAIKAIGIAIPFKKWGAFGVSYTEFGNNLYKEQKLGLCFAKSFGDIFSFGLQLDYLNTFIGNGYGSNNAIAAEIGIQAQVLPELIIAGHLFNPSRAKLATTYDERIPSILKIGLAYTFSDKAIWSLESEKDITQEANFKSGIEYHAVKHFYLRCGISSNPVAYSFGIGLIEKNFKFDFSETIYQQLNGSPSISLMYLFD